MSQSQVISFRASGHFLNWIEAQRLEGESVNQASQRILKEFSGMSTPSTPSTGLSTQSDDSVMSTKNVDGVDKSVFDRLDKIEARLLQLEVSPIAIAEPESGNQHLTIFDTLEEVETSLQSSGLLGLTIEEEQSYLLQEDFNKLQADYDALLQCSSDIIFKLRVEVSDLRSQLETERDEYNELDTKLSGVVGSLQEAQNELFLKNRRITELVTELDHFQAEADFGQHFILDRGQILNALKSRRKKSTATYADIDFVIHEVFKNVSEF